MKNVQKKVALGRMCIYDEKEGKKFIISSSRSLRININ